MRQRRRLKIVSKANDQILEALAQAGGKDPDFIKSIE